MAGFDELRAPGYRFEAPDFPGSAGADEEFEFADSKIVRNSLYYDNLGPMMQLGLMPGM